MKRFLNWKTACMGLVTSLVMTAALVVAYTIYCNYLSLQVVDTAVEVETTSDEGEEVPAITVTNEANEMQVEIDATPSRDLLKSIFGYHFVLYKELCNNQRVREGSEPILRYRDLLYDSELPEIEFPRAFNDDERAQIQSDYENFVDSERQVVESRLSELDVRFAEFNGHYDYWICDQNRPDIVLTNAAQREISEIPLEEYAFLFQIDYDEHGVPTISDRCLVSGNTETFRKNINSVLHESMETILRGNYGRNFSYAFLEQPVEKALLIKNPENCSIIIGLTWTKYNNNLNIFYHNDERATLKASFSTLAVFVFVGVVLGIGALCGALWLNPGKEEKRATRILARAPFELVGALVMLLLAGVYTLPDWMTQLYLGERIDRVSAYLFAYFLCLIAWYVGGCLGEMRIRGVWGYLKKRCLLILLLTVLIRHCRKVVKEYHELNLGMNLRWKILRLVIFNALIVTVFCCVWFLGIIGVIIYSILLYFLVMQYVTVVKKDYEKLQRMTMEMSEGNLKYEPEGNLGLFEPVKEDLVLIRNGFDKAVQEEVKSHKMRTELITNVSHDLKTPLTAIITYVNLLKEKNLTEEQRAQYVDTLDKKSLRLRRLIEDLFEVSKANSGNVQLNVTDCDLGNLIKQCYYEVEDQLKEKGLVTRLSMPEGKVILKLDGEKTYRIYENILNNIVKYAMSGTRVYLSMTEDETSVTVTIKNITEAELYVPASELSERFVRGDASRGSIEGSGLGLAIVRSFTELQGGKFEIDVDGDLFKVTTIWRKNI